MKRVHKHPPRGSSQLSKVRRLGVYGVGLGLWLSGGLWLVFHYLLRRSGPFGPGTNPLEPWWLKAHGAFAFVTLWLFGLIWGVHIVNGWANKRRRWTGGALIGVLMFLILSGYLLYYVGDDQLRAQVSLIHWIVGLGAPAAFLGHRFSAERRK